jgi:hypothetical protein
MATRFCGAWINKVSIWQQRLPIILVVIFLPQLPFFFSRWRTSQRPFIAIYSNEVPARTVERNSAM